jgi:outer membrane protein OmpA-like peptidoglycan-associated protein
VVFEKYSWPTQALQVASFQGNIATLSAVKSRLDQQSANPGPQKSATRAVHQPSLAATPPFVRHPVLFGQNSQEVNAAGSNTLQQAATWLKAHADSRVLIVGSCDTSGSESCTLALAEARGVVVRKFLENCGVSPDQVVGVKGWNNADHDCRPNDVRWGKEAPTLSVRNLIALRFVVVRFCWRRQCAGR